MINLYLEKVYPSRKSLKNSSQPALNRVTFNQESDTFTPSAVTTENKSRNALPSFLGHFSLKKKSSKQPQAETVQTSVIIDPPPQIPKQSGITNFTDAYYESLIAASYKY